jgi:hypothetical protein
MIGNMRSLLAIVFVLFVNMAHAQSKEASLLTGKTWTLDSDEMTGLGTHISLTDNTKLEFAADGTWKSSEPIKGTKQGKWSLENNNKTLLMDFQTEKMNYLILQLSETVLQYQYKKNAATFKYKWAVK